MKPNSLIDLLRQYRVIIPPIQRDYAQGRPDKAATRVRKHFLTSLMDALDDAYGGEPLNLDFIYGYVCEDKTGDGSAVSVFKPLDGQQRLTTLFLLHWYAAVTQDETTEDEIEVLAKFSYATRSKSRQFCERLVGFQPETGNRPIREQIENQPWFFMSWFKDPTVASMLVVLDAIEAMCRKRGLDGLWWKLAGDDPRIRFHLLEMTDIGLPDDLYIKMNSRGKELTDFEHFKSLFSRILSNERHKNFIEKIDNKWSDLFWSIFKDEDADDLAQKVDAGFLRFFWYVTDLLVARKAIHHGTVDEWALIQEVYSNTDCVDFLFFCLDLFAGLEKNNDSYFEQIFYDTSNSYEPGKTRLFFAHANVNLFHKCARTYDIKPRSNPFSIGEQLLLYAFIWHKAHETEGFPLIVRRIRNLIAASEDRIRNEYLGELCRDVERIVESHPLSEDSRFSKAQLREEGIKSNLRMSNPELEEVIFKLEDHDLLRGTISVFDLEEDIDQFAEKFQEVFHNNCDYIEISRAMLAVGDYAQGYGHLRRFGNHNSGTWRELFTPNEYRKNFDNTRTVLKEYLRHFIENSKATNGDIISANERQSIDWRYYFIRYDCFRAYKDLKTEGFYYWENFEDRPFECYMMYKRQFNGRHWVPYLLAISELNTNSSVEDYGSELRYVYGQVALNISMQNDGFMFGAKEEDEESQNALESMKKVELLDKSGRFHVKQNSDGEDNEDRVRACANLLEQVGTLLSSTEEK